MNPTLRTTLYLWKCTFIGLLLGLDAAWLLSRSIWLEMRVSTGLAVPVTALAALTVGAYTAWRPKRLGGTSSKRVGWAVLLVQVPLCLALTFQGALAIVPAALVREALPGFPPLGAINPWLLVVLAVGIPSLLFDPDRYCSPHTYCGGIDTK